MEAPEIFPFLGTSRLAEVIDRHGADLVLHGHAHHGKLDGHTRGGVPVHHVADLAAAGAESVEGVSGVRVVISEWPARPTSSLALPQIRVLTRSRRQFEQRWTEGRI